MPFCTECGAKLDSHHKFCNNCGTPSIQQSSPAPPPTTNRAPPPPPPVQIQRATPVGEPVILTITGLKKMKRFGMYDSFFLTASNQRVIVSPLTKDMINQSVKSAQEQAKSEGKGFFGQWKAQLGTSFNYADMYLGKTPDQVLAENPGSIMLPSNSISQVELKSKDEYRNDNNSSYYLLYLRTNQGVFEYRLDSINKLKALLDLFKGRSKSNVYFF